MKNKLADLNNILFEQLERLNDEDLQGEKLTQEIERSKAIANVTDKVIANGALALKAEELKMEYGCYKEGPSLPEFIGG